MFMRIEGSDTHFNTSSAVTFNPAGSIFTLPLVQNEENMFLVGMVMPSLLAPYSSVDVTVTTGSEKLSENIKLELLPFPLDEGRVMLTE